MYDEPQNYSVISSCPSLLGVFLDSPTKLDGFDGAGFHGRGFLPIPTESIGLHDLPETTCDQFVLVHRCPQSFSPSSSDKPI